MFGKNKITKKEKEFKGVINVTEIFQTIQGEGPHSGRPCVFVRFQGCCLKCKFCDTQFDTGVPMSVPDIVDDIDALLPLNAKDLVVITGGEPMLQCGIVPLVAQLVSLGIDVQIETSGSHWQNEFDEFMYKSAFMKHLSIVCSPKTGKLNSRLEEHITAYKYVIIADQVSVEDGLPTVSPETGKPLKLARPLSVDKFNDIPLVYVMPCDAHNEEQNLKNMHAAVRSSLEHGHILCLQVHKIIGVE